MDCIPAAASDVYNLQDNTGGLDSQGFGLSCSQSSTDTTFNPIPTHTDSPGTSSGIAYNSQVNWGCQPFAGVGKRPLVSPESSPVKQKLRVGDDLLSSLHIVVWCCDCSTAYDVSSRCAAARASQQSLLHNQEPCKDNAQHVCQASLLLIRGQTAVVACSQAGLIAGINILCTVQTTGAVLQMSEPEVLAFRGRRSGTSQVRRKLATNAVMQNYKPPPTAPVPAAKVVLVQRTINELFSRQTASPAQDTVEDMQLV